MSKMLSIRTLIECPCYCFYTPHLAGTSFQRFVHCFARKRCVSYRPNDQHMYTQAACAALKSGHCLEIRYDGFIRIVEVHAVGYTKEGNPIMRVWQISGGSGSGEPSGWKLLRLDETLGLGPIGEPSAAPRQGYRQGDKVMSRIVCQL